MMKALQLPNVLQPFCIVLGSSGGFFGFSRIMSLVASPVELVEFLEQLHQRGFGTTLALMKYGTPLTRVYRCGPCAFM
jgi:hypothetical protein